MARVGKFLHSNSVSGTDSVLTGFATLVAGITTAGTKSATFKIDLPIEQDQGAAGNTTLYVFAKVDSATGTPKFGTSTITWQE